MIEPLRILRPAWVPAGILIVTAFLVWLGKPLPASLAGLRVAGPFALLITAVALAWWFNRGRAFVAAASMLAALAAWHWQPTRAMYLALVVLVPFNLIVAMARPEVGARHGAWLRWALLIAIEATIVHFTASYQPGEHLLLRSPPVPLAGRLMLGAAFAAAVWRAWPDFSPAAVGAAGALVAFYLAAEWARAPGAFAAFMTAAGLILVMALLHESHRLAFRDQLTGLPGRRALEERLRSLEDGYTIAMVDVDHFKQFNDQHGHDIGDQVLKLVAGRLAEVGGGGTAYRYGGEEFSVIFPRLGAKEAHPYLEAIRGAIERYRMAVRGEDRPRKAEVGAKRRGRSASAPAENAPDKVLSVTVSIGIASPGKAHGTPQQVVKAADEALYAAKKAGRNRVSVAAG